MAKMREYDRGYTAALCDIADLVSWDTGGWRSRDEALFALERYLEGHGITREWVGA